MSALHDMDNSQFTLPVRLQLAVDAPIDEVYCVEQAISLIERWHPEGQDQLRLGVLKYCRAALDGEVAADDAQKALVLLARKAGVLARDMSGLVAIDNYGELVPLSH